MIVILTNACADGSAQRLYHEPFEETGSWNLSVEQPGPDDLSPSGSSATARIEGGQLQLSAWQDGPCTRAQARNELPLNSPRANGITWRFVFEISQQDHNAMGRSDVMIASDNRDVRVSLSSFSVPPGPIRLEIDFNDTVTVRRGETPLGDTAFQLEESSESASAVNLIAHGCSPDNWGSAELTVEHLELWELTDISMPLPEE